MIEGIKWMVGWMNELMREMDDGMNESDISHVLLQGPDWAALPRDQMRLASSRCGSPSAVTSNFLWSPTAADCAVDSANRPDTTRCAATPPPPPLSAHVRLHSTAWQHCSISFEV